MPETVTERFGTTIDNVLRELDYIQWAGWGWLYGRGECARAQQAALHLGFVAIRTEPELPTMNGRRIALTEAGRAELASQSAP